MAVCEEGEAFIAIIQLHLLSDGDAQVKDIVRLSSRIRERRNMLLGIMISSTGVGRALDLIGEVHSSLQLTRELLR